MHGQPGTLAVNDDDDRQVTVSWRRTPGQWVTVTADGEWSTEAVVRVAEGLRDKQQTAAPAWKLAFAPAGSVLDYLEPTGLRLMLPGTAEQAIDVSAFRSTTVLDHPLGRQVTGGERPSWLLKQAGKFYLTSRLTVSTWVEVQAPATAPWTEEGFRRLAAGVDYIGPRPP